jgi:hypothetical protein
MSIEFSPAFDSGRSSLCISRGMGASPMRSPRPAAPRRSKKRLKPPARGRGAHATRKTNPRRVAANRRNAQRSTGPRTAAGKRRASRNAIKHGLCSPRACLPGECAATYATFVAEVEEELQPRTPMQRSLVPHIANLMWRIDRLPQAQADMFELELRKVRGRGQQLTASQLIARRFSGDPTTNGFLLIGRYERGLHNQLLRLMSRYEWLKKHRPTVPVDQQALLVEHDRRMARIEEEIHDEARRFNAEQAARELQQRQQQPPPETASKRTQSNPTQNWDSDSETGKCAENDDAPLTKRTHCAAGTASPPDPLQSATLAANGRPAAQTHSECS